MNTGVWKAAVRRHVVSILCLLPLLLAAGHVHAQSYAWMDNGTCPWNGSTVGAFETAPPAYSACMASMSAVQQSDATYESKGEYSGPSDSDPACTDPPTSAGVQCYIDIWYTLPAWGGVYYHYAWITLQSVSSPQFFISATPLPQGQTCSGDCVGPDPINPATGNVFTRETDIAFHGAGAISYSRFYNSVDTTGVDGVSGWRHSYARYVSTIYSNPVATYSSSHLVSGLYSTPSTACTSGFSGIKTYVAAWASATATYSNGACVITVNSTTVATLPIYATPGTTPQSSPIEYDVVRDDGQVVRFPIQGGVVTNLPGVSLRLAVTGSGFTVTDDDDNVENYNSSGVLQSITSRSGVVQTLSYTGGYFSGVTDSFGNSLSVTRNSNNTIASVSVSGGGSAQYSYNSAGQLSQVTNLDGTTRSYTYLQNEPSALLTGIIDENGVTFTTFAYNSALQGTQTQDAGSVNTISLSYSTTAASVVVTDALGAQRTFKYTLDGDINAVTAITGSQCPTCQESAATSYDSYGWVASRTDYNGNLTCYANDPVRGLELVRVEGFASGSTCPSNLSTYTPQSGTLQRKITTAWSTSWREPATITEPNRTTSFTYDSYGNALAKTVTDTSVTPNVSRTWTYAYYNGGLYGQVETLTGPRTDITTDVTTFTYYSCATGGKCGQIDTVTNGLGQVTTINSYNVYGQPLTSTDPNSVTTTLTYDARERLTSSEVGTETTSYSYWPIGLVKLITLPDSSSVQYSYDTAHRLTKITDGAGNYISYTLDAMSNRTADNWYSSTGTLLRTHTRVFNTLSELYKDINAAGTSAVTTVDAYDSNGNLTSSDAPLSRDTALGYDALNRVSQITDPNSGITTLAYDANGNLASVVDPRTLTTSYTHDGFNEVTGLVSPDTGTSSKTYDSAGNLATTTDARSAVGTYSYDALNRETQVAYSDQTINFTYDAGTNGVGRLTGAADASHSMSWSYDTHGRVTGKGQTVAGVTESVGYAYTNGDLTSLVTPSGQIVLYAYTNHRITSITVNGTTLLSGVTYDPFGPVTGWTWGNSTTVSRTYDQDYDPSQIVTAGVTNGYTVDDAQRITGISDSGLSSNTWTFGYDSLDRVTSASSSAITRGYTFDANSNMLTETGTVAYSASITPTNNQIASTTGGVVRTYSYDAAGNTTGYASNTYTFNQRGRMSSAVTSGGTTNYVYNALGQLIEKSGNGGTTLLMYDEWGHIIGEYSSTGALIEETIWMGNLPVATVQPNGGGVSIYYIHTDHLGTPRKITNPSGNTVVWRWDPDTFGSLGPSITTIPYNLRFPGQYYQAETGLNQNVNRDYDPLTGRYIEPDPSGLEQSGNLYVYVGDDPVDAADPFGLYTVAPGVPAPSPVIQALLNCIESKTGLNLLVTSTSKISTVHPAGTPHANGVAVDVAYPANPSDAARILCAAAGCGAGFALDEKLHPSKNSTGPHIHMQIPKGTRGGGGDLPATSCGSPQCSS